MMMTKNWFPSFTSLYGRYLRHTFSSAGLSPLTVEIDDGETTLHVWAPTSSVKTTTASKKKKKKPSLVLIHGFGPPSTWQWGGEVCDLSRDFDLYVPDLVFFGDVSTTTRRNDQSGRSEVFQAECVGKMMDMMVGPEEKYSVAGTSYGGFVAYHLGRMWPERVEKVVVASSAVNMTRVDKERLLRRSAEEEEEEDDVKRRPRWGSDGIEKKKKKKKEIDDVMLPKTAAQVRILMRLVMYRRRTASFLLPDFILNDFVQKLYKNTDKLSELLSGLIIGRDEHHANITPLQQEVLIVWGEHDQLFLLEKAFELKDLLGEKARLEVIKKTSHLPHLEDPRRFNHILRTFLFGTTQ